MRKKIYCPSCECSQIQYLKRDKKYWCRYCGHEWKKKEKGKK